MVVLLLVMVLMGGVAFAGEEFSVRLVSETPEPIYELRGQIRRSDQIAFYGATNHRRGGWLILDSIGGSEEASIYIGREVRRLGIKTIVKSGDVCLSGCAMIWAAGKERWAEGKMNLGFHRPWHIEDGKFVDGNQGPARAYYRLLGFSPYAIDKLLWPANSFFWMNEYKARMLKIDAHFKE